MSRPIWTVTLLLAACGCPRAQDGLLFKQGDIQVEQQVQRFQDQDPNDEFIYNRMMFDSIHFGMNFLKPSKKEWHGHPEKDLSRWATTYWHRRGPTGVVLEKFNWFHGPDNTYAADARLPASLAGLACAPFGSLPVEMLAAAWSEPPIGGVGLAVGTLASYARPMQSLDFFEPKATIRELSLPTDKAKAPYFRYVRDALDRGVHVRVIPGAPRQSLADIKKAPDAFYHVLVLEPYKRGIKDLHEDLLTKEALALCMSKLVPDGILCVHISNRYYDLVPIIADNAASLKLFSVHGLDTRPDVNEPKREAHFSSEWVMVARRAELLAKLQPPPGSDEKYWQATQPTGKHIWTDKGPNSFEGLYRDEPPGWAWFFR